MPSVYAAGKRKVIERHQVILPAASVALKGGPCHTVFRGSSPGMRGNQNILHTHFTIALCLEREKGTFYFFSPFSRDRHDG